MTLSALRDDALRSSPERSGDGSGATSGTEVRLSLPWIRSLPLASLLDPVVHVGGRRYDPVIVLGDRRLAAADLADEEGWWYLQDRVVLEIPDATTPGIHEVSVSFRLEIPYLPGGPDDPLRLPFVFTRELERDATASSVSRDVSGDVARDVTPDVTRDAAGDAARDAEGLS
ncbi:hypothetical protein IFU08_06485 [Microbacterium sp. CFBP 8790]|uniref:hypothetical protein n=1 Tax=unclassified Microbacterium TaxID=2609290 RepID=UPI00178728E9|nr:MULTISPECIES: hypothetical protein [unclassified Microbacterium]MBD8206794.1 hypothetical protein [Microbacterium sp. CFBP 8801]MBD8509213.1 hypothetical protein [Microbacterium sp. CFBP 8790]